MSFIDNIIGAISPKAAFERARYRAATSALRKFEAAASGRRTSGWQATGTSANAENGPALTVLRERSRDLVRNNPYAKIAMDVISTNTVGSGIRPTPKGLSENQARLVLEAWDKWAGSTACDYDGRLDFYGIQKLAMRSVAESGEVLILKRKSRFKKDTIPVQLQVLEADFLDLNRDRTLDNGNYIMQGIEFSKEGKRVAYWLYDSHPGDSGVAIQRTVTSNRIPADDVIHIYHIERPGQVRGIPFGTSAMLRMKDFDDYEDAQLVRQKIAACFAVFVQDANADAIATGGTEESSLPERVEPGIIEHLPTGKTVTFASPPAAEGYSEYSRKILQAIASGYGITYEAMTGDLSNVNFSSGRMGWLEFHRRITDWQYNLLIPTLCNGVWSWFVAGASLMGQSPKNVTADWTPPRREMIDPTKETNAYKEAIRSGLISWQEAVREQGYNPDELIKEMVEDMKRFDTNKIVLESDARHDLKDEKKPKD